MFEKEIEVSSEIFEEIAMPSGYISSLAAVLENPLLHEFYKHYLRAVCEHWIERHIALLKEFTPVKFSDAALLSITETLNNTLLHEVSIIGKVAQELCASAVKARYNYLLRPRNALKWFVFGSEPLRPAHAVRRRLCGLTGYDYLTEGLLQWLDEGSSDEEQIISVIDFTKALAHIDYEYLVSLSATDFVLLFEPIIELFGEIYQDDDRKPFQGIPTPAAIIFLDDKQIAPFTEHFENLFYDSENPKLFLTKADIFDAIEIIMRQMEEDHIEISEYDNGDEPNQTIPIPPDDFLSGTSSIIGISPVDN